MQNDLMLNIVRPSKPSTSTPTASNTAARKKQKYSITSRKQNKSNRQGSQSSGQFNLLPSQFQQSKHNQNNIASSRHSEYSLERPKRPRNFQKEDNYQQKGDIRGTKRVKRDDPNSRDRPIRPNKVVNPTSVKISTPTQIQPENVALENKIDVNPLDDFKLHPLLHSSLFRNEISKLTDIQIKCFKPIFNGKNVIAKASTGSGKTLAYLIPLINQYLENKTITKRDAGTVLLIICPTRELCIQGHNEVMRCLKKCPFIVPGCLIGGQQPNHQKMRLRKGVSVLFSTPGRLIYHLNNTKSFKLDNIKTIVFEQADRTLDMGFQKDANQIIDFLKQKVEANYTQKVLVSAHFNEKVEKLIQHLSMDNPTYIGFEKEGRDEEQPQEITSTQQINISKNLKQQYVLMTEEERIPLMIAYLQLVKSSKVMIFVSTIDEVEYLDYILNNIKYKDSNGIATEDKIQSRRVFKIHGDLDQKYRTNTYLEFRKQKSAVMISTEVASRGLDFPDLNHIILFDVPPTLTDYGNRVGRSARFNSSGVSLLMLHYQQSDYAEQIRFYCPKLELLEKDIILDGFSSYLQKLNIRDNSLHYIEGLVRGLVKDDDEKYALARKAYTSMLRAYARMKDRHIFAVKRLDLKLLGRCFGINSTGGKIKKFNPKAKESHLEAQRKRRKVENVRSLQVSEYL